MVNSVGNVRNKNILFLQGPMGTFFKKLDKFFQHRGALTYRIGFSMGDQFFSYRSNYTAYRNKPESWSNFIEGFLLQKKIDKIFLFGDCRYYQRIARKIAYVHNIDVYVFEEGYLRPDYITLEKFGVNNFSELPRDPAFYQGLKPLMVALPKSSHPSKSKLVLSATLYYALSNIFSYRYPHYIHHRDFSAVKEFFYALRGVLRKGLYVFTERNYLSFLTQKISKKYYFVPLQTHNDFQILQHSYYRSIEKFIIEVLESFAHHAPKDHYLVFKHHPVDRGRKNYSSFIEEQASLIAIEKRVLVFHDVHLPDCLKHSVGTITINSTVGLSAIGHQIPTLVLGDAVYDIPGLSNKGTSLKKFWHQHKKPDDALYQKFRQYLIRTTQLNGSFYGRMPDELIKG